jgi:hypothetical protein
VTSLATVFDGVLPVKNKSEKVKIQVKIKSENKK